MVVRGVNDDEVVDFAAMTIKEAWHVRFIELMPLAGIAEFVPSREIQERIRQLGTLEPYFPQSGNGPAQYYRLPGAEGTIGFISPLSEPFCAQCNRLRLTADGKLRPCLLSDYEVDLREHLRDHTSPQELKQIVLKAINAKPEQHCLADKDGAPISRRMSKIGG